MGLLHRGSEKIIEGSSYSVGKGYYERMDYVSTITQEVIFVHGIERMGGSKSGKYEGGIRTMMMEYYRIMNHSLAITTHAIDLGVFTTML